MDSAWRSAAAALCVLYVSPLFKVSNASNAICISSRSVMARVLKIKPLVDVLHDRGDDVVLYDVVLWVVVVLMGPAKPELGAVLDAHQQNALKFWFHLTPSQITVAVT